LCAHHARLWDRKWAIAPDRPPGKDWQQPLLPNTARLFATLLVQGKLLYHCPAEKQFSYEWRKRIETLLDAQTPAVPDAAARMGLPADWKKHPLWACLKVQNAEPQLVYQ
jgi:abortive infection bacteriophage resistance protein